MLATRAWSPRSALGLLAVPALPPFVVCPALRTVEIPGRMPGRGSRLASAVCPQF